MQCSRLLVVDKDASLGDALSATLPANDFQIDMVACQQEAWQLICSFSYTVAIVKIEFTTAEEPSYLQQIKSFAENLPVIVISPNSESKFVLQTMALGAFAFIKEPPAIAELLELIKAAVETAGEGDNLKIVSAMESWVEIIIPAKTTYIGRLSSFWRHLITGLSERECNRVIYACRELVQNAIEHGSCFMQGRNVYIRYFKCQGFLMFHIEDEGVGFCMDCVPHAAVGERKNAAMEVLQYRKQMGMRPGGLGIASVMGIADELIYSQKGNAVAMIKYLPQTEKQKKATCIAHR